jgi:acyl-CoA thioester hydrolase
MKADLSRVQHSVTVRFRDLDALGHVNYAVYLSYLEDCLNMLWEQVLVAAGRSFDPKAPGMVTVRAEIDYRASATCNQVLQVETWVSKLGRTSFATDYRIIDKHDNKRLIASARTVQVVTGGVNRESGMPESIRRGLQQFFAEPSVG